MGLNLIRKHRAYFLILYEIGKIFQISPVLNWKNLI